MKFFLGYYIIFFLLSCKSGQIKPDIADKYDEEQPLYIHYDREYEKSLRRSMMKMKDIVVEFRGDTIIGYKKNKKK